MLARRMKMKRRDAREKAFQILFSVDNESFDSNQAMDQVLDNSEPSGFLTTIVAGVFDNREEIDRRIASHLENWSFKRLATVEKTLLRIATFEIFYNVQTPSSVAINEAVELAHVYGDEKSGKFINGVLSKMIK